VGFSPLTFSITKIAASISRHLFKPFPEWLPELIEKHPDFTGYTRSWLGTFNKTYV